MQIYVCVGVCVLLHKLLTKKIVARRLLNVKIILIYIYIYFYIQANNAGVFAYKYIGMYLYVCMRVRVSFNTSILYFIELRKYFTSYCH